jgi:hypothetical protein
MDRSWPEEPVDKRDDWSFAGARRQHLQRGLRLTPAERLRWLEETVDEMRRLQGLARQGRPIGDARR